MENSNIPIVGQFTVNNIKWSEDENVFILDDGTKYRAVILSGNQEIDIKQLDKTERDAIVGNVKEVFRETDFHFKDLDQVKISKSTLSKGDRVIAQLDPNRVQTISLIFSQIMSLPLGSKKKERGKSEANFERDTQEVIKESQIEGERVERESVDKRKLVESVTQMYSLNYEPISPSGDCLFAAAHSGLKKMKKEEGSNVSEFRKIVVAELRKPKYLPRVQEQIANDLRALKAFAGQPEDWEKELALYQPPLKDIYSQVVPLIGDVDIEDFTTIESILSAHEDDLGKVSLVEIYLQTMAKDKAYGGPAELLVIQDLYGIPIRLFTKNNIQGFNLDKPYIQDSPENNLHLLFEGRHFDLFYPKSLET